MTSYLTSIDTFSLSRTVFEIFDFKVWFVLNVNVNIDWNKSVVPQFSNFYFSNFYWHFLSISNRFWDIWLQSFQGLTLTFRGHLRSKIFSPFEIPYMTSYLTSIDTFSLSLTVFEIFDFEVSYWMWMWMYTGIKVLKKVLFFLLSRAAGVVHENQWRAIQAAVAGASMRWCGATAGISSRTRPSHW